MQGRFRVNTSVLFPKVGCRSSNCSNKIAEKYSRQLCQQHKQYSLWLKERAMNPRLLPSHIQVSKQPQEKPRQSQTKVFSKVSDTLKGYDKSSQLEWSHLKPWTPAPRARPPKRLQTSRHFLLSFFPYRYPCTICREGESISRWLFY